MMEPDVPAVCHPKTKHLLQLRLVQGDDSSVTMDFDRPSSATDTPDLFK